MRKVVSVLLCALLMTTAFALFGTNIVAAVQVEGRGHCFVVENSTYLDVSLCSSVEVNVTLESIPKVVSFLIETDTSDESTYITLGGFEPDKKYYRHEDGYLIESFVTDGNGNYSYTQDLSEEHHVFIQEESSTIYIYNDSTGGQCSSIGTWDYPTATCRLTTDVLEMIVLGGSGITLDGNGHSVTYGVGSYGIYSRYKSGLTVKNIVVSGFSYGIILYNVPGTTITGNTIS
ncbi:MAG: hypothetical protein KAW09_04630, partial [Thermoplasmata archaeon]|nr:hypothetical protein [Thermoplasmata archaeon]